MFPYEFMEPLPLAWRRWVVTGFAVFAGLFNATISLGWHDPIAQVAAYSLFLIAIAMPHIDWRNEDEK